jgi:flagellar basal body-associated protein FliL
MRIPGTHKHISNFALSYTAVLLVLAGFGCYAAQRAGMLPSELQTTMQATPGKALFTTEMSYYDLPRMTVAMAEGPDAAHVRLDISLEIANKDKIVVEGYQPRMTDTLNHFLSTLRPEQLQRPNVLPWLREELLKQVNSVGSPAPVHDLTFRQFVIM